MKLKTIAGLFLLFAHPVVADSALPEGAIQEGSLSNQKLIQDAMVGVVAEVATRGVKAQKISCHTLRRYLKERSAQDIGVRSGWSKAVRRHTQLTYILVKMV
jgi:hypothetical protein